MPEKTVTVRGREGTSTNDISIPARIARDHDIVPGDEFTIDTGTDEEGRLVLRYIRVDSDE